MSENKLWVWSYNFRSLGALNLCQALDIWQIKHEGSKFKGGPGVTVINWGCGDTLPDEVRKSKVINPPSVINNLINKISFFDAVSSFNKANKVAERVHIPFWTTSRYVAKDLIEEGELVVQREIVEGRDGAGLTIAKKVLDIVPSSLYTCYIPFDDEYRVHVIAGKVVDVLKKVPSGKKEITEDTKRVKTTGNGYIFSRDFTNHPKDVETRALRAFNVFKGLTFAGFDVGWSEELGKAIVLEGNSAPELLGATVDKYAEALREIVG